MKWNKQQEIAMTIQQCRYVVQIAKTGSFSEAAKQMFVAQSSLSVSIKSLEQELNTKLFERAGNGVYLTEAGTEFVRYAKQICESSDFVLRRYSSQTERKHLNIATQHYDFVADVFGSFLKTVQETDYQFSLREIETYNVIRQVETAYSDIGIIAIKDGDFDIMKRYLGKKKLSFEPILQASPHVFFRREHPLSHCSCLRLTDLKEYPCVSYEQGEHNSSFFTEELMDTDYIEKHIEISDRATLMNLLLVSDAYTVGTGIMPSALNRGDIVSIPLESEEFYIIGYLVKEDRKLSGLLSAFVEQLKEMLSHTKSGG
jgi:DNA-binding transcriptional LysR family regulator